MTRLAGFVRVAQPDPSSTDVVSFYKAAPGSRLWSRFRLRGRIEEFGKRGDLAAPGARLTE